MYVRLAFAVAAHLEPEILLVDEVLAVGDAEFQKKCMGKMESVAEEGRTVLFVSHSMNVIENLCQAVILLDSGRIREKSTDVRSVIRSYMNPAGSDGAAGQWINPGNDLDNEWFKPLSFSLSDGTGRRLRMPVRNDADIWIEIEGELKQNDPRLNVGYAIFSEDGSFCIGPSTRTVPNAFRQSLYRGCVYSDPAFRRDF